MSHIDSFMQMMNCDRAAAMHFLDMAQGDLDTAVALYFSMNDPGHVAASSAFHEESAPAHSAPPAARQQPVGINIDSDSDDYMEIDREYPAQSSRYAADLDRAIAEQDGQRQQAAHLQQKHRLFSKAPSRGPSIDSFANFSEPERGGGLSKMFGMPVFCINANPEISTFLHAKQSAASMFRKLIVNVLDQSMVSLDQNRDLWGHDDVAALVVEHYCLFQLHQSNDAAVEYLRLYPLRQGVENHKLPIIDILDPLTGMLRQRLSGAVAARQLCGILRQHSKEDVGGEVIFSHSSYTSPPSAASQSSHASASMASPSDSLSVWSSLGDGGDDDFARAIAASLGDPDASAPLRPRSPVRAVSSAQKVRDETDLAYKESLMRDRLADEERERARRAEENRVRIEKETALEEARRTAQAEQARSLRKSELQARFTDGRRVKRKFDRVDVVRSLYDYVELEFGVSPKQVIICTTMPRIEIACCDEPLSQHKVTCASGFFMSFAPNDLAQIAGQLLAVENIN